MDNMNAENFTEREIHVYDPVDKAVDGEMDYLQANNAWNVDKDPNEDLCTLINPSVTNFVNLAPFPIEIKNPEDALAAYNEHGLWNKI